MIRKVSICNFKSLRDVRIDLERFTVVVGPNASGKSSILQGLHLLCRCFHPVQEPPGGEIAKEVSRGAENGVALAGESGGEWFRYLTPSRSATGPARGTPLREVAANLDSSDWTPWKPIKGKPSPFSQSVLLRLEASKLMPPAPGP